MIDFNADILAILIIIIVGFIDLTIALVFHYQISYFDPKTEKVTLSYNDWHFKLQQFTFSKRVPKPKNLWPYMALTSLCIILFPITILISYHFCKE